MSANTDLIEEMWKAWAARDVDRIMSFFTDDPVYDNPAFGPPSEGVAAVRRAVEGFVRGYQQAEFIVHHQLESKRGVVMNERTDRFLSRGKWVDVRAMGTFEIEGGKIKAWRDYYDRGQVNRQRKG